MNAGLSRARSAVDHFQDALQESVAFDESLAAEYNKLKVALAASFQTISLDALPRDQFRLSEIRGQIENTMRELFSGRVESSLFVVRGYTTPHPDLYAYLASRVGAAIPAWRLRLLTRDAMHTERRTRELRDLGLSVDALEIDNEAQYLLRAAAPDLQYGAAFQLRRNALESKRLSKGARTEAVRIAEETAELPEKKSTT